MMSTSLLMSRVLADMQSHSHAEPRATKDLDILISADIENSRAIYAALAQFGAPVEGMSPADFTEPDNFFRMGTPPVKSQPTSDL
jgi:hypothetical protein